MNTTNYPLRALTLTHGTTHTYRDTYSEAPYGTPSNALNIEATGRLGRGRITVKVDGYWSTDTITLYINRRNGWDRVAAEETNTWTVELTHSSGGRLTELSDSYTAERGYVALESDLDAEACFGQALIDTAALGRRILQLTPDLEAWYQVERQERQALEEQAKAEQAAKAEADMPLGKPAALAIIAAARAKVTRYEPVHVNMFERGSDYERVLTCQKQHFITWYLGSTRKTEDEVIALLSSASHRSCIS